MNIYIYIFFIFLGETQMIHLQKSFEFKKLAKTSFKKLFLFVMTWTRYRRTSKTVPNLCKTAISKLSQIHLVLINQLVHLILKKKIGIICENKKGCSHLFVLFLFIEKNEKSKSWSFSGNKISLVLSCRYIFNIHFR